MEKIIFVKGAYVVLETNGECVVGRIVFVNSSRTRIELDNVEDFYTQEPMNGVQIFYKSEIKSIRQLADESNDSSSLSDESLNCKETSANIESAYLTIEDIKQIKQRIANLKYIVQTDSSYHKAINDLKSHEFIGLDLNVENNNIKGRYLRTSILCLSTIDAIYIFDIFALGKIHTELKQILENKWPKKIVHNSCRIADNLKFQQNVQLNSIFDTMIAHTALGSEKKIVSLRTCIATHFQLPSNFIEVSKDLNWSQRPLSDEQITIAAQQVAYLHKLYEYLLHERMLKSFYNTCQTYLDYHRKNDETVEVAFKLENETLARVESFHLDVVNSLDTLDISSNDQSDKQL